MMPTVTPPLFISSRRMAALRLPDGETLHLEVTGRDHEGRITTRAVIENHAGEVLYDGVGPSSGCGDEPDYTELMGSLIAFIEHDGDNYRRTMGEGEPDDGWLFNETVAEWAYANEDALSIMRCVLEPED